jgi:hypothetical protein
VLIADAMVLVPGLTFALHHIRPNPTNGRDVTIALSVPSLDPVEFAIIDVTGRIAASHRLTPSALGPTVANLPRIEALPAGMYVVRVVQREQTRSRKLVVLR